jgi:hypothetical protein
MKQTWIGKLSGLLVKFADGLEYATLAINDAELMGGHVLPWDGHEFVKLALDVFLNHLFTSFGGVIGKGGATGGVKTEWVNP